MTADLDDDTDGIWRDPTGTLALGPPTSSHSARPQTCITYCRSGAPRRGRTYCPHCHQRHVIRSITDAPDLPPEPRHPWLAALLDGIRRGRDDAENLLARGGKPQLRVFSAYGYEVYWYVKGDL